MRGKDQRRNDQHDMQCGIQFRTGLDAGVVACLLCGAFCLLCDLLTLS